MNEQPKNQQPAAAPTRCYQCGGCGDNDVAPGHCVRCNGSGVEPHPVEQPASAPLTMTLNPAAPPLTMAPAPADERAAFEKVFPMPAHCQRIGHGRSAGYAPTEYGAWEASDFIRRWEGWKAARAASANETGVEGAEPMAVPAGWKLVRVNEHFDALITSLERAESKGYLPDSVREEWENFACDENGIAPQPPAQAADSSIVDDALRYRTLINMIDHGDAVVLLFGHTASGPYLDDMLDRFKEPK